MLGPAGKRVLVVGKEGVAYAPLSDLPNLDAALAQRLGLMGQYPTTGVRSIIDADQIALHERGAARASVRWPGAATVCAQSRPQDHGHAEWTHSPVRPGSTDAIASGMPF